MHRGKTKTGKDQYYFSMKSKGNICTSIPDGYEIYERPNNSQVFLRKIPKKIILDEEVNIVERGMKALSGLEKYKVDISKNIIRIYAPDQDINALRNIINGTLNSRLNVNKAINEIVTYSPNMQFKLIDKEKRIFSAQRYCYLGRIDDWIDIGSSGELSELVSEYVVHLGEESFFDLH